MMIGDFKVKENFFTKKVCQCEKYSYLCNRKCDGSSVGLERMLDRHEVTSSILVRRTKDAECVFFLAGTLAQSV